MQLGMFASPGSYPDRPLADVVDWYVKVVQKAEELGYSEFWMASHTTSRWARISTPRQFIARALGLTSRIRLGPAVEVLYQQHPVTLAAQIGELDQVCRARLMVGLGAGGPFSDLETYAVPGKNAGEMNAVVHRMMLESIEILLNCWKEGGPQDFRGEFWNVRRAKSLDDPENYAWHLKPYNSLDDRIAVAGFSAKSHSLSVAGERGWIPLSWSVSKEFADIQWETLSEAADRVGRPADRSRWRQVQMIYVAETDAEARKAVVEGFAGLFWDKYWDPIFRKTGVMDFLQRRVGDPDANLTPADLIDRGIWCVGSPDRVTQKLQDQIDSYGGFGTLLQVGFDYSGAGAAGWMRNMELLAKEVMPRLKSSVSGPTLVGA